MSMNSPILEKSFLYKALRFILYVLLFMPVLLWSIFLFPFITTKILYFRILVEAAAVLYLLLAIRFPEIRPQWNWLSRMVWILLGIIIVTSIFGVNFYRSFWGNVERGDGIITFLHFVIYFTILSVVMKTGRDWLKYFLVALIATVWNALYAVAQFLNFSFVINTGGTRVTGTIGNASFFAAFMIFGIFISLYLISERKAFGITSKFLTGVLWAVAALDLFVLYESQTRGAVIGLAGAFILYAIYKIFESKSAKGKLAAAAVVVVVLLSAFGIYAGRNSSFVQKSGTLNRLAGISLSDITTQSRLDTWKASWLGWKDRFWTGYGYENYNIAFNKYFPARIFKDQGSQIWFDRAHNIIFDYGVSFGIFGLLAYLSVLGIGVYYLFKIRKSIPGSVILLLGLLAYFFQNFFVFDTQATYLMFFLVLAHISWLHNHTRASEASNIQKWSYRPGFIEAAVLTVLFFIVTYFVNLQPAMANYDTTNAMKAARMGQYRDVKTLFEKALSYGTYMDEEIRQRLVDYANESVASGQLSTQEQSDLYKYTLSELQKNLQYSPRDVKNYLYLMSEMNQAARYDQTLPDQVILLGEKAIPMSPTRPQIYFELGQAYFYKKNSEAGLEQFRKAVALNPETEVSHFNYLLGAIIAGRQDIVDEQMDAITRQLNYSLGVAEYQAIARAYVQAGNKQMVVESYKQAVKLAPNNADLHANLAAAYGNICDTENARYEVGETIRLNPSFNNEAQAFLTQLDQQCKK